MFTKPPPLKDPSFVNQFNQTMYKNKKIKHHQLLHPKPNTLKTTSNPKPLHQSSPKNSPNSAIPNSEVVPMDNVQPALKELYQIHFLLTLRLHFH